MIVLAPAAQLPSSLSLSHRKLNDAGAGAAFDSIAMARVAPDRGGIVPSTPSTRAAPIFQADYGEVTYLSFESVLDDIYRLEYSLPSDTNTWFETGWEATGDGTTMLSFDPSEPTGSSTDKNYRIRSLD